MKLKREIHHFLSRNNIYFMMEELEVAEDEITEIDITHISPKKDIQVPLKFKLKGGPFVSSLPFWCIFESGKVVRADYQSISEVLCDHKSTDHSSLLKNNKIGLSVVSFKNSESVLKKINIKHLKFIHFHLLIGHSKPPEIESVVELLKGRFEVKGNNFQNSNFLACRFGEFARVDAIVNFFLINYFLTFFINFWKQKIVYFFSKSYL